MVRVKIAKLIHFVVGFKIFLSHFLHLSVKSGCDAFLFSSSFCCCHPCRRRVCCNNTSSFVQPLFLHFNPSGELTKESHKLTRKLQLLWCSERTRRRFFSTLLQEETFPSPTVPCGYIHWVPFLLRFYRLASLECFWSRPLRMREYFWTLLGCDHLKLSRFSQA